MACLSGRSLKWCIVQMQGTYKKIAGVPSDKDFEWSNWFKVWIGCPAGVAGRDACFEPIYGQERSELIQRRVCNRPPILEAVTALRGELDLAESRETLLREAWMRKCLSAAEEDGFQNIAVVCGA